MYLNRKSFSLVELLITLIIISLLIAAFSPLITKKMKASNVTVGSFGNNNGGNNSIPRNVTKQDCQKLNAIYVPAGPNVLKPFCVMKYNIGDTGLEDWAGVQKCSASLPCTIQNGDSTSATKENLQATCFQGITGGEDCNNDFGGYDGCKRTVCNWTGANQMCTNIGWRLPTYEELTAFTNTTYSSDTLAFDGLMFCDYNSSTTVSPACPPLENGCLGTKNGYCHSDHIWSDSFESSTIAKAKTFVKNKWGDAPNTLGFAFSARCVLDTINENFETQVEGKRCNCENGICENNKAYCTKCNKGYKLYDNVCIKEGTEINCYDYFCASCSNTTNGTCLTCKQGYTLHNGKCYFGSIEGCNNLTYDDTYQRIRCNSCQDDYFRCDSGSCRLKSEIEEKTCPPNTMKIGCICVAKYNIGDGYYGEKIERITKCTPGINCNVLNGESTSPTVRNLEAACWDGSVKNTAGDGCNANYGGYDGCQRTICNWLGGQKMCESIGWRLPTMPELQVFANDTYSHKSLIDKGKDSLMFCNHSNSSVSPVCPYFSGCPGGYDNNCDPMYLWSSSFSGASYAYRRQLIGSWGEGIYFLSYAFSARCVKDL